MSQEQEEESRSFAELFESYNQGMNEDIRAGDRVRGKIIAIGREDVYVDTGTKIDGVVDKGELLDDKGELPFQLGDRLDLYVVSCKGDEIRLSRALSGKTNLGLIDVFERKVPVEGKVKAQCKGGFHVEILQHRAFCPISQMDLNFIDTPEDYVGKTFHFLISGLEEDARNVVVSRRDLLWAEQEKGRKAFLENLTPGAVLQGRIKRVVPFGAFVELCPGVEGLVHITELSWSRVREPGDLLGVNDSVEVKVIGIEKEDSDQTKIALSLKQLLPDPWTGIGKEIAVGDKVRGKVTRCTEFGAFVEISAGIEGLVHISEMTGRKKGMRPEQMAGPGEMVYVTVKEIDPPRRRISLSMKETEADPWFHASEKYPVGRTFPGILEKKERYGLFLALEPGVSGLLPKGNIARARNASQIENSRVGDRIFVSVEEMDMEKRRITFSPADPDNEEAWRGFIKDQNKPVSSLGEKLQKALLAKK
jgi:small subunit ribosomal protein S1